MSGATGVRQLHQLAALYGVQTAYYDVAHRRRTGPVESLLAVLKSLGACCVSFKDVPAALRERRQQVSRRTLEPVIVAWDGGPVDLHVRHPASAGGGTWSAQLTLESGERRVCTWQGQELPILSSQVVEGSRYHTRAAAVPARLPWGYHRITLEAPGLPPADSMIISAPTAAYSEHRAGHGPSWGVFLPLYALHTASSWGSGDLSDLEALAQWTGGLGGELVGALPMLPGFLDEPLEPSPYAPVSRLFWNEFYLDLGRVPELDLCPPAQRLVASAALQEKVQKLRAAPLVDYRQGMELKRCVLEQAARCFFSVAPPSRLEALGRFVAGHPLVENYARFRAVVERQKTPWRSWPQRLREGDLEEGDYDGDAHRYHLYAQWQAHQQTRAAHEASRHQGVRIYLDLPLGVHPDGYDSWRWQDLFVDGAAVGAPPDTFFARGQNWGFHPLHPEKLRQGSYQYFISCLRHHMSQAGLLRIDHIMGLHRQFWVPQGVEPGQGVYVRYPAEEFYGILCLESHRARTGIVGEDLGTVSRGVRAAMGRHGLGRMYVVYFNLAPKRKEGALRPVPRAAMASINTHDLPTFAAFMEGSDINDRLQQGYLGRVGARRERRKRERLVAALRGSLLGGRGTASASNDPRAVLRALLAWLARSPASYVLVNLEDLWLEPEPQNRPGTGAERDNWRRKSRYSFEEFRAMPQVVETLQDLGALRNSQPGKEGAMGAMIEHRGGKSNEVGAGLATTGRKSRPVYFRLEAPTAGTVAIAGDFNGWDEGGRPLRQRKDGLWWTVLRLPPGVYQYKFVVDGADWREDPMNPSRVVNVHGTYNSVCEVS